MQAKFKGQLVEVWKICHQPIHEKWVQEAFDKSHISWNEWNKNVLNFEAGSDDLALVGDFLVQKEAGKFYVVSKENIQRDLEFITSEVPKIHLKTWNTNEQWKSDESYKEG
ncbi:hypothetical protein [Lactococcus kimchii]|uniref:hypothetical protein n=1 Tax=Lactococcus sp. S-13 TaxID=2507158 RepID=UPI001CC1EEAA|nr:hypothetical protein [Lactococcus sp. S-13]